MLSDNLVTRSDVISSVRPGQCLCIIIVNLEILFNCLRKMQSILRSHELDTDFIYQQVSDRQEGQRFNIDFTIFGDMV